MVTALALGLVLAVARLLGGTVGDAPGPSARPVVADAATTSSSPTPSVATSSAPTGVVSRGPRPAKGSRGVAVPLASPSGSCANNDIVVTPSVTPPAYGGKPVVLTMTLTTKRSPACTWTVSADALVVKVTSGEDRIWSTQQCPGAVFKQEVVVRRDAPVSVRVVWSGQRSDDECSRYTDWAMPGYYHVAAAAFGADPLDEQFELVAPLRPTVTRTPSPSASGSASPSSAGDSGRASAPVTAADGTPGAPSSSSSPTAAERTPGSRSPSADASRR